MLSTTVENAFLSPNNFLTSLLQTLGTTLTLAAQNYVSGRRPLAWVCPGHTGEA